MNAVNINRNTVTVAVAVELATRSIIKVLGSDCAKTQQGQKLTRQVVTDLAATKIGTTINDALRG